MYGVPLSWCVCLHRRGSVSVVVVVLRHREMKGRLRLLPRAALSALFPTPRPAYQLRRLSTPLENEKKDWNWVPPRQQQTLVQETELDTKLEVIQGYNHPISVLLFFHLSSFLSRQYFTPEEVASMMENLKGMDVRVVKINGKLDGITHFIIGSGESSRHLQTMADSLVRSVRHSSYSSSTPSLSHRSEREDYSMRQVSNMVQREQHLVVRPLFSFPSLTLK